MSPADLGQEIYCRSEGFYLVVLDDLMCGDSFQNGIDDFFEFVAVLRCVLQDGLIPSQVLLEDNSRTVQHFDLAVQFHFLQRFGASRDTGDITGLIPLQTVDNTALAHIWIANQANSHCSVRPLHLRKLFDQLYQVISSN